jgi:hypothetical protein
MLDFFVEGDRLLDFPARRAGIESRDGAPPSIGGRLWFLINSSLLLNFNFNFK